MKRWVIGVAACGLVGVALGRRPLAGLADGRPRVKRACPGRILSLTPSQLWEREERDETFATRREDFMRGRFVELLRQLVPSAALDEVECRRGSCMIEVSAEPDEVALLDAALGFVPFGDRFETAGPETAEGRASLLVHVSYANEHLDAEEFQRWFEALWSERWRLARERYERDLTTAADGGVP